MDPNTQTQETPVVEAPAVETPVVETTPVVEVPPLVEIMPPKATPRDETVATDTAPAVETPAPAPVEDETVLTDDELPSLEPEQPSIETLQAQIAELRQQIAQPQAQQPQQSEPAQPTVQIPADAPAFATDEEFDAVMADRGKANEFFTNFKQSIRDEATRTAALAVHEVVAPQLVQVAQQTAVQAAQMAMTAYQFYAANPDLVPYRQTVQQVTNAIVQKHPDWPQDKVLAAAARESKRAVAKHTKTQPAVPGVPVGGNGPAFAPPTGAQPAVPSRPVSELQADLRAIRL
jgi:hypothetical protein